MMPRPTSAQIGDVSTVKRICAVAGRARFGGGRLEGDDVVAGDGIPRTG